VVPDHFCYTLACFVELIVPGKTKKLVELFIGFLGLQNLFWSLRFYGNLYQIVFQSDLCLCYGFGIGDRVMIYLMVWRARSCWK
jgi:hypothetical protein